MNPENSVIGVYKHIDEAEEAVRKLGESGFPIENVSIIAKDIGTEKKVHGFVTSCDVGKTAAKTGAWVGGIFGLLVGAAFLWVPGVGPLIVAGSLTAALAGGLEGAVAGAALTGFLGWLSALGISKEHILKYASRPVKYTPRFSVLDCWPSSRPVGLGLAPGSDIGPRFETCASRFSNGTSSGVAGAG